MSLETTKKPFQKFSNNGGQKPFNKFKKGGKKNSFLQNAKGFSKKGNFGRGTNVEEEEFKYFLGILEAQTRFPFGFEEEKVAMTNNVLNETKGKEVHLASNQVVSKVLENVMGFADEKDLERFFEVFTEGLRPICSDIYSSHVLQKMLEIAFIRAVRVCEEEKEKESSNPKKAKKTITDLEYNTTHEFTEEHRTKCSEFVVRVCKFLLNNLEDFVTDSYACHLIRAAIHSLAGIYLPKSNDKDKKVKTIGINGHPNFHRLGIFKLDQTLFEVPAEWNEILLEFPGRLQMWPHFKEFPYSNQTSCLLQIILIALNRADKKALEEFGKKLIDDTFKDVAVPKTSWQNQSLHDDNVQDEEKGDEVKSEKDEEEEEGTDQEMKESDDKDMPSVFKSDSSVRLLQTLIAVAPPKLLTNIKELFENRIKSLVENNGIYAVTRLINYVSEKSDFEAIFDELCPLFEKFIQTNRSHLITAISVTCLRLKTKQAALITALQNVLHCNPSQGEDRAKAFFRCLTILKPFEVLPYDKESNVTIFGSLIIQDILHFNKPIFLVNSILETETNFLLKVFQSQQGSYIADKFFSSPTIGEKSREKLVKLLEGFYIDLAVTQTGSRVIELFVKASNENLKAVIAKELTAKENKLKGSPYGAIVYKVLRLATFQLSSEQWKASWSDKKADKKKTSKIIDITEETEGTETVNPSPTKKNKNKKRSAS